MRSFTSQLFRILLVFLLVFVNTATFPSDSDSYHSIPNGSESETEDTEDTEDIEESNLISLSDPESLIVVGKPDEQKLHDILEHAYNSQQDFISRIEKFVVGIHGQNRLMTMSEAYEKKLITAEETGAILDVVDEFDEGETSTLRIQFGLRSGEDIVIGRYPSQLLSRPRGMDAFNPADPALVPLTKWLSILGHMTWVKPVRGGGGSFVQPSSGLSHNLQLTSLSASLHANHYNSIENSNINAGAGLSARGAFSSVGWADSDSMGSIWFSVMYGWAGVGYSGKYNIEERQYGLSSIGGSGFVAGWKNYVQMGASISAVTTSGEQFGLGGVISLSKDRTTSYKHRYHGEYDSLIDDYIREYKKRIIALKNELIVSQRLLELIEAIDNDDPEPTLRKDIDQTQTEISKLQDKIAWHRNEKEFFKGKHYIEVVDSSSKGVRFQGGSSAGGTGLGFRAGVNNARQSIHRFYTHLDRAHELLKDGNGDKIALLRIPEEFDRKDFPDLSSPHKWNIGEEVITTVERTFYGSIVVGLFGIPNLDAKAGISGTVTGTFEMGVRRLPGNKIELSLRPTEIKELGAFISTISAIGPHLVASSTVALAMRQTFIFDLDNQKAIDAYSLLLTGGVLPLDFSHTAKIVGKREAENLLDVAAISRRNLAKKGILLTHLEKIDVPAKKFSLGIGLLPGLKKSHWAGLTREYLHGQSKVISTNGSFAVSRVTAHEQVTKGQGRSGSTVTQAFATLKRVFTKAPHEDEQASEQDTLSNGYIWRFQGITLRAKLEDSKITDNEQNKMVDSLNSMFHANIKAFPDHDAYQHKQTREILIERELTPKDLDGFNHIRQSQIDKAARGSGLGRSTLTSLVADIEDKGHNQIANIVKEFVEKHGIKGVSAVHLMLNGNCRNLILRTTSDSYSQPLSDATKYEALYTNAQRSEEDTRILDVDFDTSESKVRKIYADLRKVIADIERALADLKEDPLFEGEDDLLKFGDSKLREKKSKLRSRLLAAKNKILDLLDLESQGFSEDTIVKTYEKIHKSKRDLKQRYTLLYSRYKRPISLHDRRKEITQRWKEVKLLISDIETEQSTLTNENTVAILGQVYIDAYSQHLQELLQKTRALINIQHLEGDATRFIEKMTKKRVGLFPARPIHHEIAGHMQNIRATNRTVE